MKVVELNEEEITALLELIDAGVRARGLAVAGNAAILAKKLQMAEEVKDLSPETDM